jgi:Uma2 family endonuclease
MTIQERILTVEEFEAFTELPENVDSLFEFIGGELVEVPSNPQVSKLATRVSLYIGMYLLKNNIGHLTGEAGGYIVSGERYAPDVAFIAYEKQPELAATGYNPNPPDLAVEIISSNRSDERDKLRIKVTNYLAAGTVVWVVEPEHKRVEVHIVGEPVKIYREKDTISGGQVLPDFELKVADIFQK